MIYIIVFCVTLTTILSGPASDMGVFKALASGLKEHAQDDLPEWSGFTEDNFAGMIQFIQPKPENTVIRGKDVITIEYALEYNKPVLTIIYFSISEKYYELDGVYIYIGASCESELFARGFPISDGSRYDSVICFKNGLRQEENELELRGMVQAFGYYKGRMLYATFDLEKPYNVSIYDLETNERIHQFSWLGKRIIDVEINGYGLVYIEDGTRIIDRMEDLNSSNRERAIYF